MPAVHGVTSYYPERPPFKSALTYIVGAYLSQVKQSKQMKKN